MITRTCANPACSVTFEQSPYSWKRFCSSDCAWSAHRGTTHAPWKRGTSEALARQIAELLRTDRGAQDRFNTLLGRSVF